MTDDGCHSYNADLGPDSWQVHCMLTESCGHPDGSTLVVGCIRESCALLRSGADAILHLKMYSAVVGLVCRRIEMVQCQRYGG